MMLCLSSKSCLHPEFLNLFASLSAKQILAGPLIIYMARADAKLPTLPQTGFITLKSESAALQGIIAGAVEHLGPALAQTLMRNVGGNALRSELNSLSNPLRRLVTTHPRAQAWLEQALMDESFPSPQVPRETKMLFLRRLVG